MSSHIQQNEHMANHSQTQRLPVVPVAAVSGLILAVLLLFLRFPLFAAAGLWFLGQALVLIGYAFYSRLRHDTEVWEIAIAGQILGIVGIALLFLASLIG